MIIGFAHQIGEVKRREKACKYGITGGRALGVVEDAAAAAAASSGARAWPGPLTAEVIKARFYVAMAQHHQAEQHQ